MAYQPPEFNNNGLVVPTYDDIKEHLLSNMKTIFGQDFQLAPETPDYQMQVIIAKAASDAMTALKTMWLSHDVDNAEGVALDILGNNVGIWRLSSSRSTVLLSLTGDLNTRVEGGKVASQDGTLWDLPEIVIFTESPLIVTATCVSYQPRQDAPDTITSIVSATIGIENWKSVTNPSYPSSGRVDETDTEYRLRIKSSFAPYGQSSLEALNSRIKNIDGVTKAIIRENPTSVTDERGIPSHSISAVVSGGQDEDIFNALLFKGEGVGTYGDIHKTVTNIFGETVTYSFFRSIPKVLYIKVLASDLGGFTPPIQERITSALVGYVNSLAIGEPIRVGRLWEVAMINLGSQNVASIAEVLISSDGETYSELDYIPGLTDDSLLLVENVTWQLT